MKSSLLNPAAAAAAAKSLQSCLTLCNPMDSSMPGFPVLHCLPELAQTHVHWVDDAIQPSHPLLPPTSATAAAAAKSLQWCRLCATP